MKTEINKASILSLPIYEKHDQIIEHIKHNQAIVIAGETGSGKTTQLPKFCSEAGFSRRGKIAVTQPRRIAATSMARRVADELGCSLGSRVGYRIRFDEKKSSDSEIMFMTDGILLTEIPADPLLKKYQAVIIDEAHERSLNIDFLLGYMRKILKRRPDLRLIISSATIDTDLFSEAFNAPVITVSGRLFPVEVLYAPVDDMAQESGTFTYIDAAVRMVEQIVAAGDPGDVLVFMPTEQDIMETVSRIESCGFDNTLPLPLFSRLPKNRRQRVFNCIDKRKIVVAANIAETSLTVPGIRFVIDTGLARVKRYAPHLRTNRLPVEPISRASADQRKGRCGRIEEGLCVRLYEERDYETRDAFATPEIKRSNLAGAALTMLSLRLGDIGSFPFLQPPDSRTVKDAFAQLFELGALDSERRLTKYGRQMARMPLDPHVSGMLLQADKERALTEVSIIAAGLSIADPRMRPPDQQKQADFMHKRFVEPRSDFLTLLNLWNTYQTEWENLRTQNKIRRFCREHFLSFNRMREWRDVHNQIVTHIKASHSMKFNRRGAEPEAIHRAVLAGLFSNVALKSDKGIYKTTRGKEVKIFPGSALFKTGPEWIMCHEIVETSQVFARTVAPVNPQWIEAMAPHLCRTNREEPFFDEESGSVRVYENVFFFGLPIVERRKRFFGAIDPGRATEIFIKRGLVECRLKTQFPFYKHNREVIERLKQYEARLREPDLYIDKERIYRFYAGRIHRAASVSDLRKIILKKGSDKFLYISENQCCPRELPEAVKNFPEAITMGSRQYALDYTFAPGDEHDGITVAVPVSDVQFLHEHTLDWLAPQLWEEKVEWLLRSLPKKERKQFIPIKTKAAEIAAAMKYMPVSFTQALCDTAKKLYGISITPDLFDRESLPSHLRMRVSVRGRKGRVLVESDDIDSLRKTFAGISPRKRKNPLAAIFRKYERHNIASWDIGDIPEHIEVQKPAQGNPVYGFPALTPGKEGVDLRLFTDADEAEYSHERGVCKLLEMKLAKELAWIEKDLKFDKQLSLSFKPFGGTETLKKRLVALLRDHFLTLYDKPPRAGEDFESLVNMKKKEAGRAGGSAVLPVEQAMKEFSTNQRLIDKLSAKFKSAMYERLAKELKERNSRYISSLFTGGLLYQQFLQLPRVVQAFRYCIEKAFTDTKKYTARIEEADRLSVQIETLKKSLAGCKPQARNAMVDCIMFMEEYIISLFAQQQVKTRFPVSKKRLEKKWEMVREYM